MIIKSGGGREPFEREKLERGIVQAVRKRPVSQLTVEEIINEIEDEAMMLAQTSREVPSHRLGEMVLSRLYELDRVAYVRFASVYRNFEDVDEFITEIERLNRNKRAKAGKRRSHRSGHEKREGTS